MLLRHVYLYLHLDEYPKELATAFGFRTRYVCNFLERRLHALKYHAEGFSKICVQGRHQPLASCPIVSENAVLPTVAFDPERYRALGPGEEPEFFLAMLSEGLERCARDHAIPIAELTAALDEFRRGGFRNEWTHQKKQLRPIGLQASLLCSLDADRFRLTLELERRGATVFEQLILETEPDEIVFAHRFQQVALEDGAIVVKGKFDKTLFSLPVASLG